MQHTSLDTAVSHRRIVLAARPKGRPVASDFRLETVPAPAVGEGQVLLRTLWLSIDPYMRNLMDEVGPGYAPRIEIGAPIVGGTVSRVAASRHPGFQVGELVLAQAGWQELALSDGTDLRRLGGMAHPSHALGGLGMPGFTAHVGLLDIGQPTPGETVVVAAATGAVGSVVGQIARLRGARVVGVAGGAAKVRHALEALGLDACVDRHDPQFAQRLAQACPRGIDVYFENVGGPVLDAVLPLLNVGARVPLCGFVAHYNDGPAPAGPDLRPSLLATVLQKRVRLQGFIILDHDGQRFETFQREMAAWVQRGEVQLHEEVIDGLQHAPAALQDLLDGRHIGKVVVRVGRG
ncbi:NADP-dependent oxidoreductase [Aquincola sp. J276]|uniref:NADP-dependent oxidoreductase n=1 Tax=Aquincola sp. J276 TaxID=2898432 RepID=UPI002150EE43|nr:NADP-dependent oxidoreductase [Aquincola sp. J276]MCR5867395.1 NADP-dependent oxidoreductase [Aquincola sp. J276]